jgi:predicted regulator of Ras-like GTPase activity (Roadblock/LC7/MglB family)
MALVGNLRDLKLANLIQLNCMEKNTAKLTIEHAGKYGTIYFQSGQIVHAEYDPEMGDKAIYRLLALNDGKFKVESGVRPPAITIVSSWSNLLLEGLHQIDNRLSAVDGRNREILEMLLNVKGVQRAAILSAEGEVLTGEFKEEDEFYLSAFTALEAFKMSDASQMDQPDFISLVTNHNRLLLKRHGMELVYIELVTKIQLDGILPFINKVLGG